MNLFICSTPYQVFNAVNISKTLFATKQSDLYILNVSKVSLEIYKNIKDMDLFRNVYLIKVYADLPNRNRFLYLQNRISKIFSIKNIIPNPDDIYDKIFIVGTEVFSKSIYYYWQKKNNNIELNYYEDGTGSYFRILMENRKMLKHKILNLLKGFDLLSKCKALYVYRPNCVMSRFKHIDIKQIPIIQKDEDHLYELKRIFKNSSQPLSHRLIFFDSDFGDERILNQQIKFVEKIKSTLNNRFFIKLHPNSNSNRYGEKIELLETTEGFEMINLGQNMSDKILVSIASSACITPKLIYNEEPYIIYLYKLIDDWDAYAPNFDFFINSVKDLYDIPERFFIPNNLKEFSDILSKLNEQHQESV
ncbi:polysialyltransferase family glycosyltransferase [Bacillus carboniphilus]|uniref:Polysialyltransferase family glycosyltransferase n=1 Tax=Bacillus carboniphilus TaxID=86663 RepID=A0ABN0VWQ2_9BACI